MSNAYHAEYNLNRYHTRRAEFVALLGGKCAVCGTTEQLEFDHIDRATKTLDMGKLLNVAKSTALAELEKCQLLCKRHHIEKGKQYGDQRQVPHGGGKTGKRNCYCDLCAPLKRAATREYKRNMKEQN